MRYPYLPLSFAFLVFGVVAVADEATISPLSIDDAEQIVVREMAEKSARETTRKQALLSVPAEAEWETEAGERKVIFRRIAPPVPAPLVEESPVSVAVEPALLEAKRTGWIEAQAKQDWISLGVTVYDH